MCFDLHFWFVPLHFPLFFLGPPVCFEIFCMVLPSFLHSLPRLNGLESRVCHRSVTHPICNTYGPVLYWKVPCTFGLALERNGQGKEKEEEGSRRGKFEPYLIVYMHICFYVFGLVEESKMAHNQGNGLSIKFVVFSQ